MATVQASPRVSFKNILFTTDFSACAESAFPYLHVLAQRYRSKVFVTHVVPSEPRLSVPLDVLPVAIDPEWQRAEHKMSSIGSSAWLKDIEHKQILRQGELWYVLSSIIAQENIDLVVTATHGRDGLKKLVLGSSAERIFRGARCPVLTVGPKAVVRGMPFENPKTILFATDFSPASLHALPCALSIAEENQARLVLMHVVTMVPYQHREAAIQNEMARLKAMLTEEETACCRPEYVVNFQFPAEGILDAASNHHADMIVMGVRHGETPRLASHLPWTTAYDVVCGASCPVLTVRE